MKPLDTVPIQKNYEIYPRDDLYEEANVIEVYFIILVISQFKKKYHFKTACYTYSRRPNYEVVFLFMNKTEGQEFLLWIRVL